MQREPNQNMMIRPTTEGKGQGNMMSTDQGAKINIGGMVKEEDVVREEMWIQIMSRTLPNGPNTSLKMMAVERSEPGSSDQICCFSIFGRSKEKNNVN